MKPREKKEHSERSPEKKPPKSSGRGKQLARMSKEQLKAQVSYKLVFFFFAFIRISPVRKLCDLPSDEKW